MSFIRTHVDTVCGHEHARASKLKYASSNRKATWVAVPAPALRAKDPKTSYSFKRSGHTGDPT